jgi:hypothetical protein
VIVSTGVAEQMRSAIISTRPRGVRPDAARAGGAVAVDAATRVGVTLASMARELGCGCSSRRSRRCFPGSSEAWRCGYDGRAGGADIASPTRTVAHRLVTADGAASEERTLTLAAAIALAQVPGTVVTNARGL